MKHAVLALTASILCVQLCWGQGYEVHVTPYDDVQARALELLDQAQQTVDIAQYNIRNEVFRHKLLELKARGVNVRITVDAKNAAKPWNTLDDTLEQDGFDLVRYTNSASTMAIMHHKFTIVDGALVMTGSYNWNLTAQVTNDENMIVIRDPQLVAGYQREYAELRGEVPDEPGVTVGAGARLYFSPDDRVRNAIRDAINLAQKRIVVAVFTFRDDSIARAIRDAADRGVEVWLITEHKQAQNTGADEIVAEGQGARVVVAANRSAEHSAMHHKFCVIDDQTVITGACNWTYTAFYRSNEDVLVVSDAALAARYTAAAGALVRRYAPELYTAKAFGIDAPEGGAHFLVWHPSLPLQDTGQLHVVGSHPALGAWDPARAIPLVTSNGLRPTWAGRVRLPAGARTEWKVVLKYPDGRLEWEPGPNHQAVMDARGADSAFFATFAGARQVRHVFEVSAPQGVPADAELVVTGGLTELAQWVPAQGLRLEPLDAARTRWRARADLPAGAAFRFKIVQLQATATTWGKGPDDSQTIPIDASWSRSESTFEPGHPAPTAPPQPGIAGSIPGN